MSAVVRPIRPGDVLYYLAHAEAADLNRETDAALEYVLDLRDGADLLLVAVDGKEIVGFVALTRGPAPRHDHKASLRLHVRADRRANGVGAKLLTRALVWSDRSGVTRVEAQPYVTVLDRGADGPNSCRIADRRTINFFREHGFRLEGVARRATKLVDGSFTDAALMARVIE